jgi:hypothetical protein
MAKKSIKPEIFSVNPLPIENIKMPRGGKGADSARRSPLNGKQKKTK